MTRTDFVLGILGVIGLSAPSGCIVVICSQAVLIAAGGLYARLYATQFRHEDKDLLPLLAELTG